MVKKLTYKKLLEILKLKNLDEFLTNLAKYFYCVEIWSYDNDIIPKIICFGNRNHISGELFSRFSLSHTTDKYEFYDLSFEKLLTIQHNDGFESKPKIILTIVEDKFFELKINEN